MKCSCSELVFGIRSEPLSEPVCSTTNSDAGSRPRQIGVSLALAFRVTRCQFASVEACMAARLGKATHRTPMHDHQYLELAELEAWRGGGTVCLQLADRARHLYVIGKSGVGKTTLMHNLMVQDIEAGRGLAFIDPHGDEAEALLDAIPSRRTHDVVYFDPADLEYPCGFNMLEWIEPDRRFLVKDGVITAFKRYWAESWGPRLEDILGNTVAALLDFEGGTLLGVLKMLNDEGYRSRVLSQVRDPVVAQFWRDEYAGRGEKFNREADSAVLNKVRTFLAPPPLRNILGQVGSSFNIRSLMDERRIFIANLAKGRIGPRNSDLLGSLLVQRFMIAGMERSDTSVLARAPFALYVDEFQNFATDTFGDILSEARKFGFSLTIANQYLSQLDSPVLDAVIGNVENIVAFRVGYKDARVLAEHFDGELMPDQFGELGNHQVFVKLLHNGEPVTPFAAVTQPPCGRRYQTKETIRKVSRREHGRPRAAVEGKINKFLGLGAGE